MLSGYFSCFKPSNIMSVIQGGLHCVTTRCPPQPHPPSPSPKGRERYGITLINQLTSKPTLVLYKTNCSHSSVISYILQT